VLLGTSTAVLTRPAPPRTRSAWAWARILGGVAIVAVLAWRVGTGPFVDGVRLVHGSTLVTAFVIGALTTVACAWRWRLIAGGLGVRLPLSGAVAAYYRSQFLNTTLPGGVIGDVHRAVRHGQDIGNVGLAVRAVVLDRVAGQLVQGLIAVVVLVVFPSPVRSHMPVVLIALTLAGLAFVGGAGLLARTGSTRWLRMLRRVRSDVRDALFTSRNWVGIVVASAVVVAGQLATFLLAARTAGATAPLSLLGPLTLLALLAMAVPLNIAGWGPREGVAAWAFSAAGLTATQGLSAAVTYGVLVFAAGLPGAVVLLVRWINREPTVNPDLSPSPAVALRQGGVRG
jgi:uncharacterized membrane protein YbhN (UPF0104 family)